MAMYKCKKIKKLITNYTPSISKQSTYDRSTVYGYFNQPIEVTKFVLRFGMWNADTYTRVWNVGVGIRNAKTQAWVTLDNSSKSVNGNKQFEYSRTFTTEIPNGTYDAVKFVADDTNRTTIRQMTIDGYV